MTSARSKIYSEDEPVGGRTSVSFQNYSEGEITQYIEGLKYFIFATAYSRRPLPSTCTLSLGKIRGRYEFVVEIIFSNAMVMEGESSWHNRIWWFEDTVKTLETIRELCSYIPEAIAILEEQND